MTLGPEPQKNDGGAGDTTVALDFDGVLHRYSRGWDDGSIYDIPVAGAVKAVQAMQDAGLRLVVFTARRELDAIRTWLDEYFPGANLEVTNEKPIAAVYIDDRAIRFEGRWLATLVKVSDLLDRKIL